jgi:hypothetical protein
MALYLSKQQECLNIKTQAFLYKWTHIPSHKWYVGSRTAPGCNINDGYICSSKTVKPMIIENRDEWIREILCIADSSYIISLETKYLKLMDAKNDPMSFNRHNGDGKFTSTGKIVSDATKLKMSKARIGVKKSTEHRLALSQAHKNAEYLLHRPVRYGNKSPRFVGYYISPTEEKFASAYVAASVLGVSAPTIRKWANNNLNGWKFQPKVEA